MNLVKIIRSKDGKILFETDSDVIPNKFEEVKFPHSEGSLVQVYATAKVSNVRIDYKFDPEKGRDVTEVCVYVKIGN